jgi:hypothetical protein
VHCSLALGARLVGFPAEKAGRGVVSLSAGRLSIALISGSAPLLFGALAPTERHIHANENTEMKFKYIVALSFAIFVALCGAIAHSRGFGGYHGGVGGFHGGAVGGEFRGYHGGFGVGGMYSGALDGPRGFSGYGTNWSGYRGGYGTGARSGYQGGYGLGYGGSGGLAGFDNYNRPGVWGRGVAGWRDELGTGGGYANLGYGNPSEPLNRVRPSQVEALSRIPGYLQGGLPTDLSFHQANRLEHRYGYLGDARGLTAFDPAAEGSALRHAEAPQRITDATRVVDAGIRNPELNAVARDAAITHYWPEADLRARGNIIRRDVLAEAAVGPSWYDDYAGGWIAKNVVGELWTPAAWTTVNNWFGTAWPAVGYNYGNEITYDNGSVNLYGVPIATAAEYSQSAADLAAKGKEAPPANVQWLPLGVFAAVRGEEKNTKMMLQLAVDKAGVIRGNYFNTGDKNLQQIEGAMDKRTQRVSWVVADRDNIIFDTGLYNLTKDESTVLVHFGKDKTEQWTLVRLKRKAGQPAAQ